VGGVTGLHARATIAVDGSGRCTTLRSQPPLTFRETADGLHLVGTAAGPVGGDRLRLDVTVAAGGSLTVRGVAASLVHPGPTGEPSCLDVTVEVGVGATLVWLPRPTVLVAGCDHTVTTTIRLGRDARLQWYEPVGLGREGEPSGSLVQRLRLDVDDRPLLRNEAAFGPRWPGSAGPAGTAGATVAATMLTVGADPASFAFDGRDGQRTRRSEVFGSNVDLGRGAALVTVLAPSFVELERCVPSAQRPSWSSSAPTIEMRPSDRSQSSPMR